MLKTFSVALFAIVMSVGLAHATHAHKPHEIDAKGEYGRAGSGFDCASPQSR